MIYGDGGHAAVIKDFYQGEGWIVAIGDNRARKKEAEKLTGFGVAVHKSAVVSPSAVVGEGTVIMAGAVVQARAVIGKHCIVNTCASVDHDCVLGDYVHVAPGAHLCGGVKVGDGALVSVGLGVPPNIELPAWKIMTRRLANQFGTLLIAAKDYE